jgi:hypothetical protein
MKIKQIICNACRELVEVVDHQVVSHQRGGEECPGAGQRYTSAGGAAIPLPPGFQMVASCQLDLPCGHQVTGYLVKVHYGAMRRASRN